MMHGAHIGGQRAGAFLELVRGVDPKRVLLVGVDVAKATWFVVASNLLGEVVVGGVRLVADRAGLAELERVLAAARARADAAMVVVGIEAAGHHHQTLTGHLLDRDELVVRSLNPAQVAAVRKQQGNRRRKTDWLDAAAICELLARGEGALVHLDGSAAAALRPLWSGRKDLVDTRSRLRQQAGALVDCLWPGCSAKDTAAGVTPVLCDLFATRPVGCCSGSSPRGGRRPASPPPASLRCAGCSPSAGAGSPDPWPPDLSVGRRRRCPPIQRPPPARRPPWPLCLARSTPSTARSPAWRRPWRPCWPAPRAPSSPSSAGWAWSPRPGSWPSWAPPTGGRSGRRCGERPGWTPPAASPDPPMPGSGSAGRARPGAGGRSWTWPQPSASSPGPGATVCAPAPPSSTSPPRSPSRPPPTPSGAPCLRSWPRAPTLILASRPNAPQRGRQVVKQPEPEDTGGLRGSIRRRSQAMRPDLALSLAPAPRTFLQTADVASCGQTAHAIPSACGREDTPEASQSPNTDRDHLGRSHAAQPNPGREEDLTDAMAS